MTITNVYNTSAPKSTETTKTEETTTIKEWKGYAVKDGKIVPGYFTSTSTIKSLNDELATELKKAVKEAKDEPFTWKTPFVFVGKVVTSIYTAIVDLFKSIFSICFGSSKTETETKKTEEKKTEKA